ncbi:hypothetical protein SASPL_150146 [Salvia splendens]|uniref:Uncharacterized protein n=1 Tax=Salvia splendens TaxID=180675 RepID=A0A8X8W6C4_SALSN|nr:hypothetical protein SASPL_150146 [Salvia splendens]
MFKKFERFHLMCVTFLHQLGNATIVSLTLNTLMVLDLAGGPIEQRHPPFPNLKCLKDEFDQSWDKFDKQQHAHRQYVLTPPVLPFHPYTLPQANLNSCWDPPWARLPTAYEQPQHQYQDRFQQPRPPPCWDPPEVQQSYHGLPQRQMLSAAQSCYPNVDCQDPSPTYLEMLTQHYNQPHQSTCWDPPIPHPSFGY